ncbi:hypothetical protein PAAG_11920 [Paracoccidioides lutzii Pb01]|uniref:Uncharacterized protein n=1 Tax=Paracoccidioides lutzii (strain ATCC MYA-826 / Pb01) TaxID=502779 RepID=A0A0A2V1G4_PARBA|nr:hypothetical protein PAAG_11920 [Paracoccidioides lutzii Pb01]KGQ01343.1 hypothetical protein PAAG_11920 [Paracoccidioides lutzii Pb01]
MKTGMRRRGGEVTFRECEHDANKATNPLLSEIGTVDTLSLENLEKAIIRPIHSFQARQVNDLDSGISLARFDRS